MKRIISVLLVLGFILTVGRLLAFDKLISFQGKLADDQGNVLTGTYKLTFSLYRGQGATEVKVWSEILESVAVNMGNYHVTLGLVQPFTGDKENLLRENLELGIKVGDSDNEMSPRIQLSPAPTAVVALDCISLIGMIAAFPSMKDGWLVCNGSIINKGDNPKYSNLVDYLRENGNEKFTKDSTGGELGPNAARLPDLRGEFIRGIDDRDYSSGGKDSSGKRLAGMEQADTVKAHAHNNATQAGHNHTVKPAGNHHHQMNLPNSINEGGGSTAIMNDWASGLSPHITLDAGDHTHAMSIEAPVITIPPDPSGPAETRPINVAMYFLIKY